MRERSGAHAAGVTSIARVVSVCCEVVQVGEEEERAHAGGLVELVEACGWLLLLLRCAHCLWQALGRGESRGKESGSPLASPCAFSLSRALSPTLSAPLPAPRLELLPDSFRDLARDRAIPSLRLAAPRGPSPPRSSAPPTCAASHGPASRRRAAAPACPAERHRHDELRRARLAPLRLPRRERSVDSPPRVCSRPSAHTARSDS